ncbi:UNVERIFIED_CONTAM: hypothetical protein PYX00_003256 [Menopon gallinae]|uniref:Neurotransmitter-gated ion-channel ligand-binding domain-containing protein n=1 Tax=Menopon gallinae TaxID=328185 RepID=A0AAW2HZQ7_9NEOP
MEFTLIIIFLIEITKSLAKTNFEECSRQRTFGYEYVKLYSTDILEQKGSKSLIEIFFFEFYVRAASDAHILLSESNHLEDTLAYEIVIGGGKNSFSQIRLFPKDPKTTQYTSNILSPIDYRGFWIKLEANQVIMVGRKGETEPFLFWVNNQPFQIRYFAFTTWNNVKGEWYFNCKDDPYKDSEFMEGEGNLTALERLKNDLLTLYNPTIIPQREGYPEETIEVYLDARYFHLNEKRGELTLSGTAISKWVDWKLFWNPADYDGIENVRVSPYQIWTPNIRVLNSVSSEEESLLRISGNLAVTSKGEIMWMASFHSVTLCVLGYLNWPFDAHNCSLVFGFRNEPLKINIKYMNVSRVYRTEWEIQKLNWQDLLISQFDRVWGVVEIAFKRRDPSFEFLLLPPFLAATVLALVSFWIHPGSPAKLFLNCGNILILFLILMGIGNQVATLVPSTPKIVILYSWSILVMCVPIVLFVGLKYVPPYVILPRLVSSMLNSSFIEILFLLPQNPEKNLRYSHLREHEEKYVSAIRLVTLIERFFFLIYFFALMIPYLCFLTRFELLNF